MTLGLKRIILIDSFVAGKRMPLMVDGHATVNGQNGSGKSSLLKLLQIFYGAESRHVENKAGGKDSFVDWYLRRDTSLIIFEYGRVDGKCCLVIYRHPTSGTPKPAYRFMKGEFTPERFSVINNKGELEFLRGKELRPHWQACGIPFSKQIEIVTDYRAIIQNDVTLLRRSTAAAENKRVARDYCLGDGHGTMQHIEKVCTAIQNQHGNLRRMKDMLADIMIREGVVIPEPPNHPENIGLSGRVKWLADFEQELPKIRQTLRQHNDLLTTESRISSIHAALTIVKGNLTAQAEILDKDLSSKFSDIKTERNSWEHTYEKLRETLIEFKTDAEKAERELENLYRQRDAYDAEDVQSKKNQYADLERLQGLQEQTKARVSILNETVSTQRQPFEQQEITLTERHNKAIKKLGLQKESVVGSLNKLTERYREKEMDLAQRREKALEEKRNNAEPQQQLLLSKLASAEERAKHSINTDEERALLVSITEGLARLRNEANVKRERVKDAEREEQTSKAVHAQAVEEYRRHKKHQNTLDKEVERYQQLLYPNDGSWLAELRKQDPDWVQGLGRIANPDLFNRKDLKPEFIRSSDNAFGWELDLSVIKPAEAANSDEELRARLAEAEDEVNSAQHQLEQLNHTAKLKQKLNKEANQHLKQLSGELQALEQKIASQESLLSTETQRIAEAVADRKSEAKKEAAALKRELDAFHMLLQEEISRIKNDLNNARQENQSAEAIERSTLESQKSDIENQIIDEHNKHETAVKQLWSDFEKLCTEQGIDIETINAAEKDYKDAKTTVERVQVYRNFLIEYDAWLNTQWSQRESHQKRLEENQAGVRETESKVNREKNQHEKRLVTLEKKKAVIESELNNARATLSDVSLKLEDIGAIPASSDIEPYTGTPAHLLSEATETLESLRKLKRSVSQGIMSSESAISASGDEQIAGIWKKMINDQENASGKELSDDPNYWRILPPLLESFVDDILPTIRETLVQTIVGVGQQLADYFHGLKNADSSIHSYSSKISESIVNSLDVEALSDINIRLVSNIKSLDYWIRLESFVGEWNEWRESSHADLPSNDLVEAMGTALIILDKVKSANDLRSLFSLSLELRENGRLAIIRNDDDLANASSRGLSYLALCGIFIGITHYLCSNRKTQIHWPVDELEVIDGSNINRLFGMLDKAQITMVAGFPSKDANLLRLFKHHHVISYQQGIRIMNPEKTNLLSQVEKKSGLKHDLFSVESENA